MNMKREFTVIIRKEDNWYIAQCLELDVVSQGKSIKEAKANIKEAIVLYLESFGHEETATETPDIVLSKIKIAV